MPEILKLRKLSAGYGPLRVLHEVDLTVQNGERIGLVAVSYTHLTLPTIYSV